MQRNQKKGKGCAMDLIGGQAADKAEDFELNFTLHHPITDEEWDAITDVGLDHTDNIFFHTKNGKEVEFVKRKKGKWIPHNEKSREYIGTVLINVEYDYWLCDACGYRVENGQPMYNFCPMCGADMRQ